MNNNNIPYDLNFNFTQQKSNDNNNFPNINLIPGNPTTNSAQVTREPAKLETNQLLKSKANIFKFN